MIVVLSQKVDSESEYADKLFDLYHYPARYRNQLHKGDIFVYYQGNRFDKSQRYYFGIGIVGDISTPDGKNYYAKLINCRRFEKKVPIYLPDGGYIEQLGYNTVRKNINPPWQSSVRPISQKAFDYILNSAGEQTVLGAQPEISVDELKEKLKRSVRDFFVENDASAIQRIESIAAAIGSATATNHQESDERGEYVFLPSEPDEARIDDFLEYCKTMKMSYSYKPILILSLLNAKDGKGTVTIAEAVQYFRSYYNGRRSKGLQAEKKNCIYQREDVTDQQIADNIIANPVDALVKSGFFVYNDEKKVFAVRPEIWRSIDPKCKRTLTMICEERLNDYFKE